MLSCARKDRCHRLLGREGLDLTSSLPSRTRLDRGGDQCHRDQGHDPSLLRGQVVGSVLGKVEKSRR